MNEELFNPQFNIKKKFNDIDYLYKKLEIVLHYHAGNLLIKRAWDEMMLEIKRTLDKLSIGEYDRYVLNKILENKDAN